MTNVPDAVRRPRGRPKGTGRVQPEDILAVATDALADAGYRGLTMRGVARSLGVSLSTVQHHYSTKDELWRAAIDQVFAAASDRRVDNDASDLATAIATLLEEQSSRPGLLAALLTDTDEGSGERIGYIAERINETLEVPAQSLKDFEALGLTRAVNPRAFFALMTIGIGSIAGAAEALERIYGFDLSTDRGRAELAADLAEILTLGLLQR